MPSLFDLVEAINIIAVPEPRHATWPTPFDGLWRPKQPELHAPCWSEFAGGAQAGVADPSGLSRSTKKGLDMNWSMPRKGKEDYKL